MAAKQKTFRKQRLLVLAIAVGSLTAGAAGLYSYRKHAVKQQYAAWCEEGMQAAQRGDASVAVQRLEAYLGRYPEDVEALVAYAHARPLVTMPKGGHLAATIRTLRYLLKLEPGRLEQRKALCELYAKTGYVTETVDTADQILGVDPNDPKIVGLRAAALTRLKRNEEALKAVERWCELDPDNVDAHLTRLFVLRQLDRPTDAIVAIADAVAKSHPDDARFETLQGYARVLTGDMMGAVAFYTKAAGRPVADVIAGRMLLSHLDQMRMAEQSVAVAGGIFHLTQAPEDRLVLARRQWESNRVSELAATMKGVDVTDRATDVELIALRAIAGANDKDDADADEAAAVLQARSAEPLARAWSIIVSLSAKGQTVEARQLVLACEAALVERPNDHYLRHFQAEGYAQLGEQEPAIDLLQAVVKENPTWAAPATRLAELLVDSGRFEAALEAADEAIRRAPTSANTHIVRARVQAAAYENGRFNQPQSLLRLAEEIQKQLPGEEQTLGIQIGLLGKLGRKEEALKAATAALDLPKKLSETALLRLAALSRAYGMGLEEQCFSRSEREYGSTSALAFARGLDAFNAGQGAATASSFRQAKQKADPESKDLEWAAREARLLDLIGDPTAKAAVIALADRAPDNVRVQLFAMTAGSTRSDKAFSDRTISRVKTLTGGRSLIWKIARARWLLDYEADTGTAEAITLLSAVISASPDLPESRFLMGRALERTGKVTDAVGHLTIAATLRPRSAAIGLYLVRLLQLQGEFERAREELDRIAANQLSDSDQRQQAAVLFAQQGESKKALDILEDASRSETGRRESTLLLARLYSQRGEPEKAEALYNELLTTPDAQVVQYAAEFFATRGRHDDAQRVLGLLDTLKLNPGLKELILADHALRFDKPERVIDLCERATVAGPENPATWRALVAVLLVTGRADAAFDTNAAGLKVLPDDRTLKAIEQNRQMLRTAAADRGLQQIVVAFIRNPSETSAAAETLKALVGDRNAADRGEVTSLLKLSQLAERYPRFVPLQMHVARAFLGVSRFEEAAMAATRAAQAAPSSGEPMQFLAAVFSTSGRWAEALDVSRKWRERVPIEALAADLVAAEAMLHLGRPRNVVELLRPYINATEQSGGDYAKAVPLYARAQEALGQGGIAVLMEPLLTKDTQGRVAWMRYAVQFIEQPEEAEVWLRRAAAAIPGEADAERVALAEAWSALADRAKYAKFSEEAEQILKPLAERVPPYLPAIMLSAMRAEQSQRFSEATTLYRRAIDINPSNVIALNNLAVVLVKTNGDMAEANKLVTAALKLWPTGAPLYETLAQVQAQQENYTAAMDSLATAIRHAPVNLDYRLFAGELAVSAGQQAALPSLLQKIDELAPDPDRLTDEQRRRLAGLRKHVAQPTTLQAATR
jgi:tetratricopeptide (TPR) repeat protein